MDSGNKSDNSQGVIGDRKIVTELLTAAEAAASECAISVLSGGKQVTMRGTLTGVTPSAVLGTFELPSATPTQATPAAGDSATVTIRGKSGEQVFFAPIVSTDASAVSGSVQITLGFPAEIITTRRRKAFRIAVSPADGVELSIWRVDEHAYLPDRPRASRRFRCELRELSANGFGATLYAHRIEAIRLATHQRFRVQLTWQGVETLFEARLVHPRATARDAESANCGFAFVHDDDDILSRRSRARLDSLLAHVQRHAAKSSRAA